MFETRFKTARTTAYIALLVFQLVLLGLVAAYAPYTTAERAGFDGFYQILIIILLTFTALTLIVVPLFVFILPATLKHPSLVKSLSFELAWLFVLVALWTGAVPRCIIDWRFLKENYCVVPSSGGSYRLFPGDLSRSQICPWLDAILAFTILSWVWILFLFVGLLMYGVVQSKRNRSVCRSPPGDLTIDDGYSSKANAVDLNGGTGGAYRA